MATSTALVQPAGTVSAPSAVEYAEFQATGCGYVVRSQSGVYRHDGPDALDLLHRITTNDLLSLVPGKARRTVVTDDRGRVVDAPLVYMSDVDDLLLVTDLDDAQSLERAILKYTIIEEACLTGLGDRLGRVTVMGANADAVMRDRSLGGMSARQSEYQDGDGVTLDGVTYVRTDLGGIPAWEIVGSTEELGRVGIELGEAMPSLSEATFHAIRIESGVPWPGRELTTAANPLECGIESLIDFDKGCYVGQEVIARLDTYEKVQRRLVRLRLVAGDDGTDSRPDAGVDLHDAESGRKVGWVSSDATMPTTGEWIGLGFVRSAYVVEGSVVVSSDGVGVCVVG